MHGIGAQLATNIGSNLLNELRLGFNRRGEVREPAVEGAPNGAHINIASVANFGVNPLAGSTSVEASFQIIDNLTWTKGRHSMKGGIDFQTTGFDVNSALARVFTFSGLSASGGRAAVTPLQQMPEYGGRHDRFGDGPSVHLHAVAAGTGRSVARTCATTISICSCRTRSG